MLHSVWIFHRNGVDMDLCTQENLSETWDCLMESNGELLPFILMAECFFWLFIIVSGHFGFKEFRAWRKRKAIAKQMKQDYDNKWN